MVDLTRKTQVRAPAKPRAKKQFTERDLHMIHEAVVSAISSYKKYDNLNKYPTRENPRFKLALWRDIKGRIEGMLS